MAGATVICQHCRYQVKELPDGTYLHCLPAMAIRPEGAVVDSPTWRAATTEYGYELGLYTLATRTHRATPPVRTCRKCRRPVTRENAPPCECSEHGVLCDSCAWSTLP